MNKQDMSQRLSDIHRELVKLKRLSPKERKQFFKTCSRDSVTRVCECIKNVLNANLKLKPSHLRKLSRHKQTLRALALKKTSLVRRKKLLQTGGFLSLLIPALIPAITSLLSGLFSHGTR